MRRKGIAMTDRELLELAAKAAGINLYVWGTKGDENFADMGNKGARWNPLTDDGDALRLAVKLEMALDLTIAMQPSAEVSANRVGELCGDGDAFSGKAKDPYAATRRAIVRAAAEIGMGVTPPLKHPDLPEDDYYKTMNEAFEIGISK